MDVGMVPIINENDAVSGMPVIQRCPTGVSLTTMAAALVAKLVGADCLIMLTDVEDPAIGRRRKRERGWCERCTRSLKDWKFGGISKARSGGIER